MPLPKHGGKVRLEPWGAIPLRLSRDSRLTALDLRVANEIAYHDRMSSVTKTGQGCWVGYMTIANAIGANHTNVSTSINKLVELGYLVKGEIANDRRRRVYRVIYRKADPAEPSSPRQSSTPPNFASRQNVPQSDHFAKIPKEVCLGRAPTHSNSVGIPTQYIPLSGERYLAKQKIFREIIETNSVEASHLMSQYPKRGVLDIEVKANLARFSRTIDNLSESELVEWEEFLQLEAESPTDGLSTTSGWARRLLEIIDPDDSAIAS